METRTPPIQPWTKDKLELLAKYLRAYSVIMAAQKRKGWLSSYSIDSVYSWAISLPNRL
jgi:hypothetical protein